MSTGIIFLDYDGVLNTDYTREELYGYDKLCPDLCLRMIKLVHELDAQIVLSTSWRHEPKSAHEAPRCEWAKGRTPDERAMLETYRERIIGVTRYPKLSDTRETEILDYLSFAKPKKWVAIDDMFLSFVSPHYLQTDERDGFTEERANELRKFWKEQEVSK